MEKSPINLKLLAFVMGLLIVLAMVLANIGFASLPYGDPCTSTSQRDSESTLPYPLDPTYRTLPPPGMPRLWP